MAIVGSLELIIFNTLTRSSVPCADSFTALTELICTSASVPNAKVVSRELDTGKFRDGDSVGKEALS